MTTAVEIGKNGGVTVLAVSNREYRGNRRKYEGRLCYCSSCNMDYCPGADGIDTHCHECPMVVNCPRIEDQVGEFEFACLKRLPEFNSTLILKTCFFCEREKIARMIVQQNGTLNQLWPKERRKSPKKKALERVQQEKRATRLRKKQSKQQKKLRKKIVLIAKVINFKEAAFRFRRNQVFKKRKNRARQAPRSGFQAWKLAPKISSIR